VLVVRRPPLDTWAHDHIPADVAGTVGPTILTWSGFGPGNSGEVYASVLRILRAGQVASVRWVVSVGYAGATDVRWGIWSADGQTLLAETDNLGNPAGDAVTSPLLVPLEVAVGDILYAGLGQVGANAGQAGGFNARVWVLNALPLSGFGGVMRSRGATGWAGGDLPAVLDLEGPSSVMPWCDLVLA
jgi:hypothetical protein